MKPKSIIQNLKSNGPSPTDAELVEALQAGESSALGVLYDRYASLVYTLARQILQDAQEAEDLTQEVFLTFWHKGKYNQRRGSLSSFLATLTRSRAIDRLRARSRKHKFMERIRQTMIAKPASVTPFEQASVQERQEYVREALAKLPEKQRQVLEIAYYQGLSQTEIAKQLNIPLGTVKTWSRQGLLKLRKNLQNILE